MLGIFVKIKFAQQAFFWILQEQIFRSIPKVKFENEIVQN